MKYICQPAEVKVCRFAYVERERERLYKYHSMVFIWQRKVPEIPQQHYWYQNNQCLMSTVIAA